MPFRLAIREAQLRATGEYPPDPVRERRTVRPRTAQVHPGAAAADVPVVQVAQSEDDLPSGNLAHPTTSTTSASWPLARMTRLAATALSSQKPLSSVSGRFWTGTFTSLSTGRHTVTYPKVRLRSSGQNR